MTLISLITNCLHFKKCSMNDHSIFIGRNTRVHASIALFRVFNVKSVLSYFTASLRESCWGNLVHLTSGWDFQDGRKATLTVSLYLESQLLALEENWEILGHLQVNKTNKGFSNFSCLSLSSFHHVFFLISSYPTNIQSTPANSIPR